MEALAILIIPSTLSSSIPTNNNPLVEVVELQNSSPPPENAEVTESGLFPSRDSFSIPLAQGIDNLLSKRYKSSGQVPPICAVAQCHDALGVDSFTKLNIHCYIFTSGACHSAIEYAKWKANADSIKPGEQHGPPGGGKRTPWWEEVERSTVLLFNTCDDLEELIIKYISDQIGKPVYGVGPLLPEQYWKSAGSLVHDHEFGRTRPQALQKMK
ncbi:hypothetical protein Leryth_015117 [Lithospermum erythrorhizon]|nr:hypothetical protein Leryth_015117 [Lithospermum erythrorhizon]